MSGRIIYGSTKTYTHAQGLSCCFRQWKAESHCNKLHGYALQVELEFEAVELDHRNWVVDFGGLKEIKNILELTFDHKTLVDMQDPEYQTFLMLADKKIIDIIPVPGVGCEAFSRMIWDMVHHWVMRAVNKDGERVRLMKVEVREHAGNSAYVRRLQHV